MTLVRIHYDGWLALPATFRQALRLETGDQLEVELVGGTIVLRPPAGQGASRAGTALDSPPATAAATTPALRARSVAPVAPRATRAKPAGAVLPPTLKSRGRRKGGGAAPFPKG
jgi:AbrB family looped-hinge helix DNA binding protein